MITTIKTMLNHLKSRKGIVLSLVTYAVLIMLVSLSIGVFINSVNGGHQTRIHYLLLKSHYLAKQGIEYAFWETKSHICSTQTCYTPFLTHTVDPNTQELTAANPAPTPILAGTQINGNGNYEKISNGSGFEAKVYSKDGDYYVLSKGTDASIEKLLVSKFSGSSLFEYFGFFPGNISFGWQTWNAQGGKIHANGDITFYNEAVITGVSQLTSFGKMHLAYYPEVMPGEDYDFSKHLNRWPYVHPNNYPPPALPAGTYWGPHNCRPPRYPAPDYRNFYDGYYTGDRPGLYVTTNAGQTFVPWNATPFSPNGNGLPILPKDSAALYGKNIYQQANVDCLPGNCAAGAVNNNQYYSATPKINGIYINNRVGDLYSVCRYLGHSRPGQFGYETTNINLTDSEMQATAWNDFLTATNLSGSVIAGAANGASYIVPPKLNVPKLIKEAKDSTKGMSIESAGGNIVININGNAITPFEATNNATAGCQEEPAVFTHRIFINNESGLVNKVVEIDIGKLNACEQAHPELWVPKNGLIYAGYGLAVTNAQTLPTGGLTYIVDGNLVLKGDYNYPQGPAGWQPSAAIVSKQCYLVSNNFTYPTTLPRTFHHPNYPYRTQYGAFIIEPISDFGIGYNWIFRNDSAMPNKVSNNTPTTYYYAISLVGKYAYDPRYLELWEYYLDVGLDGINGWPASGWVKNTAVVIGAALQLSNEFDASGPIDLPNYRQCNQTIFYPQRRILTIDINETIPFIAANYPCRTAQGNPWDLLGHYSQEERQYEARYLVSLSRPPGDSLYAQKLLLPLSYGGSADTHWTYHNPSYEEK